MSTHAKLKKKCEKIAKNEEKKETHKINDHP